MKAHMKGNSVYKKRTSQKLGQGQIATPSISTKVQKLCSFKEIKRGIYNRKCQGPLALILRHQNKSSSCALKLGSWEPKISDRFWQSSPFFSAVSEDTVPAPAEGMMRARKECGISAQTQTSHEWCSCIWCCVGFFVHHNLLVIFSELQLNNIRFLLILQVNLHLTLYFIFKLHTGTWAI